MPAPAPPQLMETPDEAAVMFADAEPLPTLPPLPPLEPVTPVTPVTPAPPAQQMPMPFAVHAHALPAEPPPLAATPASPDVEGPFIPDPEPYQRPEAAPMPREKTFDEMLNELPSFAGTAEVKQVESTSPASEADAQADLLADVRAQFDTISAGDTLPIPAPEPMPEVEDVIELVDDVADDEDTDGWMSTLLEGRGDDGTK